MIWLPDSDIVNYIIRKREPTVSQYRELVAEGDSFYLAAVVHFEVTRHLLLKGSKRLLREYKELVATWYEISLSWADWNTAATLWESRHRAGRPIEDPDLLIAVCALKAGATLVTNNVRHFVDLGLEIANWAA